MLVNQMNQTPDGQFQTYSVETGAYIREHFFGADARLKKMVEHLTDRDIELLPRGGHDYRKVYAAFEAASNHVGQPTVILAHTVKGWTIEALEGKNATHQMKKLNAATLKAFRDRLELPISDKEIDELLRVRRLGAVLPPGRGLRRARVPPRPPPRRSAAASRCAGSNPRAITLPGDEMYDELKQGSGKQKIATTMAFVRLLKDLMKDDEIGQRIVPIAPDEYRTFGMDSMFSSAKIYNPAGQLYESVDRKLLLAWKESPQGQMLHEGISEAGCVASATAAGSSYATHGEPMIPFYIFYSMFGFQRTGDSIWAMADQLARGFLIGATAGRTTLTGEGLQHADGHSPLLALTNPAVVHYDPAFAYEIAHIVQDGLRPDVRLHRRAPARRERHLLPDRLQRADRRSPSSRRTSTSRACSRGIYHLAGPPGGLAGDAPARPAARQRRRAAVDPAGPAAARPTTGAWRPTSGPSRRGTSSPARPSRPRSGTSCTPSRSRGRRTSPASCGGAPGPVVAVSDYMRAVPAADLAVGPAALPRPRRRRLRLRRHPRRRASLLQDRRRVGRLPGPRRARRGGPDRPRHRTEGARPLPHRRPDRRVAASSRRAATRNTCLAPLGCPSR